FGVGRSRRSSRTALPPRAWIFGTLVSGPLSTRVPLPRVNDLSANINACYAPGTYLPAVFKYMQLHVAPKARRRKLCGLGPVEGPARGRPVFWNELTPCLPSRTLRASFSSLPPWARALAATPP